MPITPGELAAEGRRAVAAGAVALHIHPRSPDGRESLDPAVMAAALAAVRAACPGIPLEVSTAAWIEGNPSLRLDLIRRWSVLPDSAGVNFGEPGAEELARTLLAKGIGIEAGLFSAQDASRLVSSGLAAHCLHVQIEPIFASTAADALDTAQAIERVLDEAGVITPRLLHGKDASAWPMLRYAIAQGYATRIGFEDTLLLPDGSPAQDNAAQVESALALSI